MMITSKYIVMSVGGDDLGFIDFDVTYGGLSLDGQEIHFLGSSFIDAVFVRPGAAYSLSTGGGADRIYFTGAFSDYALNWTGATLTLTRAVHSKVETVNVAGANVFSSSDWLVFADGSVSAYAVYNHVSHAAALPVPAGETSLTPVGAAAPDANLLATVKVGCFDPAGETVALSKPGVRFQILGSAGVDHVYVADGTTIDAASLGGGVDVIHFRGHWHEYSKSVSGSRMTLTRTAGDHIETVIVSASGNALNDLLVFADGAVRSQAAGAAVKADANVALAALPGYDPAMFVDTVAPAAPGLALLNDTGSAQDDGLSNDGRVEVAFLEEGGYWEYSTDGGLHWHVGEGEVFSLDAGIYAPQQVQVRQTDAAGNLSATGFNATGLTVDTTPPVMPAILGFLNPFETTVHPATGSIISLATSPVAGAAILQQGVTSLHGTSAPDSSVLIRFGAGQERLVTSNNAGQWSLALTHADIVSFGIGEEVFVAISTDDAGNSSSATSALRINAQAYTTTDVDASGYGSDYLDALIIGEAGWSGGIITYAFASGSGLSAWSASEKNAVRAALALYENVANLHFQEADYYGDSIRDANIVVQKSPASTWQDGGVVGDFSIPFGDDNLTQLGRFNYESIYWKNLTPGSLGFYTIVHELGHALGLGHPFSDTINGVAQTQFPGVPVNDADALGTWDLSQGIWSLMAYNFGWTVKPPPASYAWGLSKTPMIFDVAAIQALYGANQSVRTGDDSYLLPTANATGTGWTCIWDAGGVDTISNAGSSQPCIINLNAYPLTAGVDATFYVSRNLSITGGYTLAAGAVIENAVGGGGSDIIIGNGVSNVLTGGGAADQFAFNTELGSSNVDIITDFSVAQGDVIALDHTIFSRLSVLSDISDHFGYSDDPQSPDFFITYDLESGALIYRDDNDQIVNFATLLSVPQNLTASSFVVI